MSIWPERCACAQLVQAASTLFELPLRRSVSLNLQMAGKTPRLSLTPKQLESAIGVDLLALCQRVTVDGSVTAEEARELQRWLDDNAVVELPSIGYLRATIQRILADGRITPEELRDLHLAVERVMPPEQRVVARAIRRDVEQSEQNRRRPLARIDAMVAGVSFEGRESIVREYANPGDPVFLVRDRANQYSRAAIEVRLANGMQVGYVPDDLAQDLAPLLDQGAVHQASIKKIWPGRRVDVPIILAELYSADAGAEGCFAEKDCPRKVSRPPAFPTCTKSTTTADNSSKARRATGRKLEATPAGCLGNCLLLALAVTVLVKVISAAF